jgi:hypothetical protein
MNNACLEPLIFEENIKKEIFGLISNWNID